MEMKKDNLEVWCKTAFLRYSVVPRSQVSSFSGLQPGTRSQASRMRAVGS